MEKLSAKYARERRNADPERIAACSDDIARTFPPEVARETIEQYIRETTRAVQRYCSLLPIREPPRRKHRAALELEQEAAGTHRPVDAPRHSLVWDLYEAYMSTRGDDPGKRGFKQSANAVLVAARLPKISEYEQSYIRKRIKAFAAIAESWGQISREK